MIVKAIFKSIVLLALLLSGCLVVSAQNSSVDDWEEKMRKANSNWEVNVILDKSEYVVGENIYARVIFIGKKASPIPWKGFIEVHNKLHIYEESQEGPELSTIRLSTSAPWNPLNREREESVLEKEYKLELSTTFYNSSSKKDYGFTCIEPGSYVGLFNDGIKSPLFSFTVIATPNEIQHLWEPFRILNVMNQNRRRLTLSSTQLADSLKKLLDAFIAEPPGQTLRFEAIVSGLWVYGVNRSSWTMSDSLYCLSTLQALANEPKSNPDYLVSCALASICKDLNDTETADALERISTVIDGQENKARISKACQNLRTRSTKARGDK